MIFWKDFAGKEDCEGCPLLNAEICPGGFSSHGGEPIEPPCCYFDDNTDLDEWVSDYFARQRKWEAREDARIKAERATQERAKKVADTRRAMRWYCRNEIQALKRAQKRLESRKAVERLASCLAEAINATNEMFRYGEKEE